MEIELYVHCTILTYKTDVNILYTVHTVYFLIKSIEGPEPIMRFHVCTALPRVKFLSNPRRIHSKEEDEEKEEQGLPRAPICCSTTFPSPPPPYTLPAFCLARGRAIGTHPPPSKYIHTGQNQ